MSSIEGKRAEAREGSALSTAQAAWEAGDWKRARMEAYGVLASARSSADKALEASAALLLSHCVALESRFAVAERLARHAIKLFNQLADRNGLAEAQLALSYALCANGKEDLALSAAAKTIARTEGVERRAAAGMNYFGLASFWTGHYDSAHSALQASAQLAPEECRTEASSFQPLTNAAFAEVLRLAELRILGREGDLSELRQLVGRAQAMAKAGAAGSLMRRSPAPGLFLLDFESAYLWCREGDEARADSHYLACLKRAEWLPESSWMRTLTWWARLERGWATGNAAEIGVSAEAVARIAREGGHLPMKRLAEKLWMESQQHLSTAPSPNATWI